MKLVGRRDVLTRLSTPSGAHAGLWLDRYLPDLETAGKKQAHIDDLIQSIRPPASYRRFYQRWKESLQQLGPCTLLAEASVEGRMAVGLGNESVLETSVTLHRTYGVPYIPGSALKGLAAAAAHKRLADHVSWRKAGKGEDEPAGESHKLMFGDQESSGYVTFHDALWIPQGDQLPLRLDVMTVHHADYYQKGMAPTEWDDPNPVAFATAHGRYLIAVSGPYDWADAAMKILTAALAEDGIGAKTASGYGRLKVTRLDSKPEQPSRAGSASTSALPSWAARIRLIQPGNAAQMVPDILGKLTGDERRLAAREIIQHLTLKVLRQKKDRDWVKLIFEAAGEGTT